MPEFSLDASSIEQFDRLEKSMTDPYIEAALKLARDYNDVFKSANPTPEEQSDIIAELDAQWGNINRMPIKVTGYVSIKDDEGEVQRIYHEDLEVISNGFCIVEDPIYIDGELFSTQFIVKHHLFIPILSESNEDEETEESASHQAANMNYVGGTAGIDEVILELPTASYERATVWLTENYPDLLQEIDERMLNSAGTEADALFALKGLQLPPELCQDTDFARNCLVVYINLSLQLDQHVPYSVGIDGRTHYYNEEGEMFHATARTGATLGNLKAVNVEMFNNEDGSNSFELFVSTLIFEKDRSEEPVTMNIPLDTFVSITSLRSSYYED